MFISETESTSRLDKSKDLWSIRDRRSAPSKPASPIPSDGNGSPISEAPTQPVEKEEETVEASPKLDADALKALDDILIPPSPRGRPKGQHNRSDNLRATIGVASKVLGGRATDQLFDAGAQMPYAYAQGKVSVGGEVKEDLVLEVKDQQDAIRNLAFNRLVKTLGLMDDEKLEAVTDVTKLARVGRDLSSIVDKVTPKAENNTQSVHFHVFRPEARPEQSYEVIDLVPTKLASQHQLDAHDQ